MAERNAIKSRRCNRCQQVLVGKASKLKEHMKEHMSIEREAAAEAIMNQMKKEFNSNDNT